MGDVTTDQPGNSILPYDQQRRRRRDAYDSTLHVLERARRGDRSAARILLERALPPLRRWSRGRLPVYARAGFDTEDVVQDAVVNTLKRHARFDASDRRRSAVVPADSGGQPDPRSDSRFAATRDRGRGRRRDLVGAEAVAAGAGHPARAARRLPGGAAAAAACRSAGYRLARRARIFDRKKSRAGLARARQPRR